MEVFVLQHVHTFDDDEEDVKMIGVYSSCEQAEAAVVRLKAQPGFSDAPEGFHIDRYVLDEDHWTEGYVTVTGRDQLEQHERHNNGMHPTADTTAFKFLQRCGAAGDAERWALNLELKAGDILRG